MNTQFEAYIGKSFTDVERQFKSKFSNYKIQVVDYRSFVTCDYLLNRIRIYLDKDKKIENISIG